MMIARLITVSRKVALSIGFEISGAEFVFAPNSDWSAGA